MSKKMQKEMFRNCRDYLEGRKDHDAFWHCQIDHEEIVFGKQLPLPFRHTGMREIHRRNYGGREDDKDLRFQTRDRSEDRT